MATRTRSQGRTRKPRRGARGPAAPKKPRPRPRARSRWRRVFGLVALGLAGLSFGAGAFVGTQMVRLDRRVRERFDGRLFQVPSRVFSAPTILYPGLDADLADLRGTLTRLGYRERNAAQLAAAGGLAAGEAVYDGRRIRVHLRGFDHPGRAERSRDVAIRLRSGAVDSIRSVATGRELGAVLLEPEVVGAYYGASREQRELVRLDALPRHLVDAIMAVEDQRFETHHGIDPRRVVGALVANLRAGRIRQGGSTLTQQLAKNFFLTPERTLRRKVEEAGIALLLEARYTKEQILEAYLNEIYLGQRGTTAVHGVGEAARLYFGKRVANLSLAESALIAAIIQSPNGISPFRHAEKALKRRNLVLGLMHKQGRIDAASLRAARDEGLQLAPRFDELRGARYFLDYLRRQLPEVYDKDILTSEGLRIYSTLDVRLQALAERTLLEGLEALERDFPNLAQEAAGDRLQGCLMALRPQTGEVLALVGGRSYSVSQFDRCTQARRPVGSVFKPFVYVAALEARDAPPVITLASSLDDDPLQVETPTGLWEPRNFDQEHNGRVPVREALERSLNVATARLGQEVGIERVADMARRLGVTSPLPSVPSLALGVADLAPIEIARAYASLVNGGLRPEIRAYEDLVGEGGRVQARRDIEFERVLDPGTAFLAVSLLQGVVERGTAWSVRREGLVGPVGGKTGTSDDERDGWFVGFTPELVVVVWVGFDEPKSLGVPSSRAALPIWTRFVQEATGGWIRGRFPRPPDVIELEVEPATGALALYGCPDRRAEFFLAGTEPTLTCPSTGIADRHPQRRPRRGDQRRKTFMEWLRDVL